MINPFDSGAILFYVLAAGVLTLVLGTVLLALYRRALARAMRAATATGAAAADPSPEGRFRPPVELEIRPEAVDSASRSVATASETAATVDGAATRAATVYALGGLTHAAVATVLLFEFAGFAYFPLRTATVFWSYAWPVVLTLGLLYGPDRRWQLRTLGVYVGGLAILCLLVGLTDTGPLAVGPASGAVALPGFAQPLFLWAVHAVPSAFLLLFLNRTVRAVGPLLMVFVTIAAFAINLATAALATDQGLHLATEFMVALGVGALTTLFVVVAVGLVPGAAAASLAIARLRRRYAAKRLSDQMLVLDSIWFLQTVALCLALAAEGGALGLLGLLAFAAYRLVTRTGLRPLALAAAARPPRKLLLLRVFGFGRRSGRLFDLLGARWRYAGSIQMIGAPDLAARSIEPDEFLAFLGGRLGNLFIRSPADLERRMAEIDLRPDPDGRFRVNEFFCTGDTWQRAVRRLMADADLVAMDLRSFSPRNRGCVFELQTLLDVVPLARLVLLVDATTDRPFLDQVLRERWRTLTVDSPNAAALRPVLRLLDATDVAATVRRLTASADGLPVPEPAGAAALRPSAA